MPTTTSPARPLALSLAPLSLALTLSFGCSAADPGEADEGLSESAVVTASKTFLVPVDERARQLCRDEMNRHYCTAAAAQRAAKACAGKIGARVAADPCATTGGAPGPGCVRTETVAEPCSGSAPVYPTAASCEAPRARSCQFYSACLEPTRPCGDDGYALGYGERYCYAFKNTRFSAKGEQWRDGVMMCLQEELVSHLKATGPVGGRGSDAVCRDIHDFAFASHPGCYTRPGRSICFLPPTDIAAVFSTIGLEAALDPRTQRQMREVVGTCVVQTARWLFGRVATGTVGDSSPDLADEGLSEPTETLRASHAFWAAKADTLGLAR